MFTTYIKNLNDMVFPTSESPGEQPSTGVLGRIGSWLSPWRGRNPTSPTESPTSKPDLKLGGEEKTEECGRAQTEEHQKEEKKDPSSSPTLLALSRDVCLSKEENATQSSHRDGSAVCSTETAEGGPRGEEFVETRKRRVGQGDEREENRNGTSVSGNPEKNASHVTHLSSFSKQGVVWDSAHTQSQAQRQAQAQTGKKLHVYLEETSVVQCGQDTCVGQEVVRTKVTKSLQVRGPKSSRSVDSTEGLSSTSVGNKRTNVTPTNGTECCAREGVSLKSHKDSQFEPEPDKKQTEANSMGRKNAARRKSRKSPQGDAGSSPQEKKPPSSEALPEGIPTSDGAVTTSKGKSPKADVVESSVNSSSKHNPTSQVSPELKKGKTSCLDAVKLDKLPNSDPLSAATAARVIDGVADMEDDDSLYKVERKTETPESKRRSIKVSRSEVKLFTKNVPLNPKQSPAGADLDSKSALKDKPKTEIDAKEPALKTIEEEHKPGVGRITDKISLFEGPTGQVNSQAFQTPRSPNGSPVRKVTDRLKTDFLLPEHRSRSVERYEHVRISSLSPAREKPRTVQERAMKFLEASRTHDAATPPLQTAMTGMSKKSTSSVTVSVSKTGGPDSQGVLDTKEQIQTSTTSEITLKPEGQDTTALGGAISIPKEKPTDTLALKATDQGATPSSGAASESGDSEEPTNSVSLQSKGQSRTGPCSKRRKSKEPTSPVSPIGDKTSDFAKNQEPVDLKDSKQLTGKASLPDKALGSLSNKQALSDTKQNVFEEKPVVPDKQEKPSDSSSIKDNTDKPVRGEETKPHVNKDEPDTAAHSGRTKTSLDKEAVILPQKEETAEGQSLSFIKEGGKASKNRKETPSSSDSPAAKQQAENEAKPPVKHVKLGKEASVDSQQKSQEEVSGVNENNREETPQPQSKDTEPINQAESEDLKLVKIKNQTEKTEDKESAQQILLSNKNARDSGGVENVRESERSVATGDDAKNFEEAQAVEDKRKPETRQAEAASKPPEASIPPAQQQRAGDGAAEHTQNGAVSAAASRPNEAALSGTKSDKKPLKGEADLSTELPNVSSENSGTAAEMIAGEPQPESALVEQMDKTPHDSCAHGANDARFSAPKPITKATVEAVKAASETAAPPITAPADSVSERDSFAKESTPISASQPVSSEGAGQDDGKNTSSVNSVAPQVKLSGDVMKLTPGGAQPGASKSTQSSSDVISLKGAEVKQPAERTSVIPTVDAAEKTPEKSLPLPVIELSPVVDKDVSAQPKQDTVKKEAPKAPAFSEAKKTIPDSIQRLSKRNFNLPRGLSKDDSATLNDAPSSWLDLDLPKKKLRVPMAKLSSFGSESNLLDTSGEMDDEDFVEKIKKLCAPFSLPPRKHNKLGQAQPPFAMPAIREDRFEKTFDPDEFTFGLRKKSNYTIDSTLSSLTKLQSLETKSGLKAARASLTDRSILLSSLDTQSRLKSPDKEEEEASEEKDDKIKVKSRLEGSCVFSSLTSSFRGKRDAAQVDGANSGEISPCESPELSSPSLFQPPSTNTKAAAPLKDPLGKQDPAPSSREEAPAAQPVVNDSGPPLPSFNDIKLPDYLEKYLPQEPTKPAQSIQGQEQVKSEVTGKMPSQTSGVNAEQAVKPGPAPPHAAPPPSLPGNPPTTHRTLPELSQPPAQPQAVLTNNIQKRVAKGFHKRPGKMVLFEKPQFTGQVYEIHRDLADASSLQLSPIISVKVVRGCWVLYEKPGFQGRSIALEEGGTELTNMWADPGLQTEPQNTPPAVVGSIRLVVCDYSIPHIDLFTDPEGHGRVTPYHDDTVETGSFGIPLSTASIQVHSGVWLVFSDPGYQGMLAVLETGVYPFPETWGFPSPFVGSLRPLKMGGFKVENASEVKALVYEKPGFEGSCLEIDGDVFSFCESEAGFSAAGANVDSKNLKSVGSLKILGGLWVGYSEPGFEGQQHILEEGGYLDCSEWGGSEQLLSMQPVLSDFFAPHLKMFSERDFSERGLNIDLTVPIINMEDTGYGTKTQSIDVIGGVWVVFEEPGFCGEPHILERGLYGCPEDWGALQPRVTSAMPVVLDDFESTAKFKVQLFSEPGFQGSVLALEDSVGSLQDGFSVGSCKVLAGSWLAFEGQDFAGRMYVLEVGSYSDLRAMGCSHANPSILSLQTVGFEFSLPSITLFERCGLRGKRVILTDGMVNLQLAGGCSRVQSVQVEGGMWVLYEGINYRGAQIFLRPGEVPDWRELSTWQKIGSLRPLTQRQVHFRIRNRQTGLMMAVTGDLDDLKLMRIQETEESGGVEQIWFYQHGHLHCKLLEECCLSPSGSVTIAGSRIGLSPEPENHLWSITPQGFIRYSPTPNLVLDIKGGHHYDKNQVILNTLDPAKPQQLWDMEIL